MFARLWRLIKSWLGFAVESAEDPELILKQTIRDMHDKVPQMQANVVQVMATERLLQKEVTTLEGEIKQYDLKIKGAIKINRDDIASTYITGLHEKQASLERSRAQLETARTASGQAKQFLDSYLLQVKKRSDEAQQLVGESRAAKMQEQLSQAMASFKVGDDAGNFDEMRRKIQERSAKAEAQMELAHGSVDTLMEHFDQDILKAQTNDTLDAYKRDMGLINPELDQPGSSEPEKTLGQRPVTA